MIARTSGSRQSLSVLCVQAQGQGRIQILPQELRQMGPYDVEIETIYSYISAGTELQVFRNDSDAESSGDRKISLGYSLCGKVVRKGDKVTNVAVGDRVAAIGAGAYHSRRVVISSRLVCRVAPAVSSEAASMMAMLCFSLEGVHKSGLYLGDNVLVLGAGIMGQVTARLFRATGCRAAVLDGNAARLAFLPPQIPGWLLAAGGWEQAAQWTNGYGLDAASICFGGDATKTVEQLKELMRRSPDGVSHGRILFPGGARLSVLMASNMGNIELVSSAKAGPGYRDAGFEAGADYPSGYVRRTVTRNMENLMDLAADGRLGDLDTLVTHKFAFTDAEQAYRLLLQPQTPALGVLLAYQ